MTFRKEGWGNSYSDMNSRKLVFKVTSAMRSLFSSGLKDRLQGRVVYDYSWE